MRKILGVYLAAAGLAMGPGVSSRAEVAAEVAPAAVVDVSAPEPAPAPALHPLAVEVNGLFTNLATHGLVFDADADRAPLYECIARTVDPAARVLSAKDHAHRLQELAGQAYAPDFRLSQTNGLPVVNAVPEGSEAGLAPGDRILTVDGAPVTNQPLPAVLRLLRGPGETNLNLTIARADGATATVTVARALLPLPLLETSEIWPRRIGYALVNGLSAGTASGEALLALLREWAAAGLAGAIIDLRGAGGDDLAGVAALAAPFASPGSLLFALRDRDENDVAAHRAPAGVAPLDLPVMLLVDETTSGAAEAWAAIATDSLRGVLVVGRATAGDPAIRAAVPLPGDLVLHIATRRLVTGNGLILDGASGVAPNLLVSARAPRTEYEPPPDAGPDRRQTLEEEAGDRALRDRMRGDAILQRAVDVLLGLKALNIRTGGERGTGSG